LKPDIINKKKYVDGITDKIIWQWPKDNSWKSQHDWEHTSS